MYREHFKLKERPFTHSPGERFFIPNATVSDAIVRLRHLVSARDSIAVVTGGPGVGKSSLAEQVISAVAAEAKIARVDLRFGEAEEIYTAMLLALGETASGPRPVHALHALREVMRSLTAEGKRLVLSLDVSGMTAEVARHLLRLMNLAGESSCQMNLILMGPHQLHQQIDLPALIHLRQRVVFRHRVRPLTLAETERYVRHQLEAVGADPRAVLSSNVPAAVYCFVAGVPRLINTLVDATLSDSCLQQLQRPDGNIVRRTAEALGWKPLTPVQSVAPPRPLPVRSSPPKVAIVTSPPPESPGERRPAAPPAEDKVASEVTIQLRVPTGDTSLVPAVALATTQRSPTAGVFGSAAPAAEPLPGVPPMDPTDTGATGMLRLQDLDERFAESIFGDDDAHK